MEAGLWRTAARDWPTTQKKRGLQEALRSVHDCPVHQVHPSAAERGPARRRRPDGEMRRPVAAVL